MIKFQRLITKQVDPNTNKVKYTINMEVLLIPFQILIWTLKYFNVINCTWKQACIPTFIAAGWTGICLLVYIPTVLLTRSVLKKTPWDQLQKAVKVTKTDDNQEDVND